jgi:hypothetical protein
VIFLRHLGQAKKTIVFALVIITHSKETPRYRHTMYTSKFLPTTTVDRNTIIVVPTALEPRP